MILLLPKYAHIYSKNDKLLNKVVMRVGNHNTCEVSMREMMSKMIDVCDERSHEVRERKEC